MLDRRTGNSTPFDVVYSVEVGTGQVLGRRRRSRRAQISLLLLWLFFLVSPSQNSPGQKGRSSGAGERWGGDGRARRRDLGAVDAVVVRTGAAERSGIGHGGCRDWLLCRTGASSNVPSRLSIRSETGTARCPQPIPSARRSLNQKILSLRSNLEKLQGTLEQKQENQNLVRELLQMKVAAREREKERGGAAGQPVG